MGLRAKIDRLSISFGVLAAWLIVPLVLVICYEVTIRYLFGAATIWAHDVGTMLTGANFLLAIAYVTLEGGHIRVDIFYNRLSARTRHLIDLFTYLGIVLPFCIWLCWTLYFYVLDAWKTGETSGQSAWNPPLWPVRLLYLVAFVVLGLQAVREVMRRLDALKRLPGSDA